MTFFEDYPSLNNLQELISFDKKRDTVTIPLNIFRSCFRDEQKIKEAIEKLQDKYDNIGKIYIRLEHLDRMRDLARVKVLEDLKKELKL